MVMHVELQATCSALGYQEGNKYVKEPDCLETIKDLIRFLKREDETCDIRRQLGHAQILQNDLLSIIKQYQGDRDLFEAAIRLMVNLTQPAVLCFNGHVPEDRALRNNYIEIVGQLQMYKEAFVDDDLWSILTEYLGNLLKLDWENRQEEDRLLIERILIIVRNILHVPPNPDDEQRTDDDATLHDQLLWAIHVSGLEDLLLFIGSSEEERQFCMHVLEIFSLMFREQKPELLAFAGQQRSQTEKEKDERELELVREKEKEKKKQNQLKFSTRHSRFGGTFTLKNLKSISEREIIYHKSISDVDNASFGCTKKPRKIPKNRQPIKDVELFRRSTLSIRLSLKELCVQFLENCYNPLMYAVKNNLMRETTQEHDETYYLWSMRFFMEFCRLHSKQVDLISETMTVTAFHYIQTNLFNYYEMIMTDKKEAVTWARRVHLALKAYQELLLTLDSMDRSKSSQLREGARVIKSNIFYMMEFRDIFLTLLRKFDQSKQSRSYLKDLIETTHLFLKMLEAVSKGTSHFVVQKKGKNPKKKKRPATAPSSEQSPELSEQQLDELWDDVAEDLSALFQGREELPQDVSPFDAASEVDVDQQRVDAMLRIQDCLRDKRAGDGVALFRAAREVWPERNEFGTPDITPEEEFMALREICMTNIPRPAEVSQTVEEEIIDENEVEEEEIESATTSEQEFNFQDFFVRFANPNIMKAYAVLLQDFETNSIYTNHCIIKMFHRIAFDLKLVGMIFQASIFCAFQKVLCGPCIKLHRFKELGKFATYIVCKFVEVAEKDKKIFMELLFWKTKREALEVIDGYGSSFGSSADNAKQLWTEDQETELLHLFEEYGETESGKDVVDCILEHITDATKTRKQVIRQLKNQCLISSVKDLKPKKFPTRVWLEEHEFELENLYKEFRSTDDPLGNILTKLSVKRSKPKVIEKLIDMGLVLDKAELYKKRSRKRKGSENSDVEEDFDEDRDNEELPVYSSSEEDGELRLYRQTGDAQGEPADDDDRGDTADGEAMAVTIRKLVEKGYKDQVSWIQRILRRTADDRETENSSEPVPIVPLMEDNEDAMEDKYFQSFLKKIGISPPANEQEAFWRMSGALTVGILRDIADGLELDDMGIPVAADKIPVVKSTPTPRAQNGAKKVIVQKTKPDQAKEKQSTQKKKAKEQINQLIRRKAEKKDERAKKRSNKMKNRSPVRDVEMDSEPPDLLAEMGTSRSAKKRHKRVQRVLQDSDDSDEDQLNLPDEGSVAGSSSSGVIGKRPRVLDSDDSDADRLILDDSNPANEERHPAKRQRMFESDDSDDDEPLMRVERKTTNLSKRQKVLDDSSDEEMSIDNDDKENLSHQLQPDDSSDDEDRLILDGDDDDEDKENNERNGGVLSVKANHQAVLDDSDDDDVPLLSIVKAASFPATLMTQGIDSDSDIDDHIPLKRILQKKRIISDDEDSS